MFEIESAFQKIKNEADWVHLRLVSEKTTYRIFKNDKPENQSSTFDDGLMVEVLVDGHFGYAGTSDLTNEGVLRATRKAIEIAKAGAKHKVFHFTQEQRPANKGLYISPRQTPLDQLSVAAISDALLRGTSAMKISDKIINRMAMAMIIETDFKSFTSSGGEIHQNFNIVSTSFESTAQEGTEIQTRSENGGLARCFQVGAELFNPETFAHTSQKIAEESLELLNAENCPSDRRDLILAPDQMTLQVHESIGHPLEYDRILGDERNYAGWSFVQPKDFGTLQYGSPLMNVTFDPQVSGEMASYAFDESGCKATKEYLIKDGLLLKGLGSLESQARLKLPGVANSRASSWNRAPIDRMANINIEPGSSSLEQMIGSVEKGIVMWSNKSWSIDDYRNKFQFGCEYAKLIENGRLTKTIKNPNYRGTTISFWNSLKMVGSEIEIYGSPYCGKGEPNQVIRVGHATPYCLFDSLEVFGA